MIKKLEKFNAILYPHGITIEYDTSKINSVCFEWYQEATGRYETDFDAVESAYISAANYVLKTEGVELPSVNDGGELIASATKIEDHVSGYFVNHDGRVCSTDKACASGLHYEFIQLHNRKEVWIVANGSDGESGRVVDEFVIWESLDAMKEAGIDVAKYSLSAKKTFLASWGDSFVNPGVRQVAGDFFCEGSCYDADDIERIAEMEVGDVWASRHYGDHVVIRLADDVVVSVCSGINAVLPTAILGVNGGVINFVRSSTPMRIIVLDDDTEGCDEDDIREINSEMIHVRDYILIEKATPGFDGVNVKFVDQVISQL